VNAVTATNAARIDEDHTTVPRAATKSHALIQQHPQLKKTVDALAKRRELDTEANRDERTQADRGHRP
jgi:hypothetical protein